MKFSVTTKLVLLKLALLLGGVVASGLSSAARADEPARLLFVTQSNGFKHGSVTRGDGDTLSPAEISLQQLGKKSNLFKADVTQNVASDFTIENLKKYQLVAFYTTGNLGIPEETLNYFFNTWLKTKGNGFIGVHSALDTYADYEPYWDMAGGSFNGHPWNAGETVTITVSEPEHPAVKVFGKEFQIRDEIYQYKNWQPKKVRVLMSLNMAKTPTKAPYMVPVCWVKQYGEGRVFVTNLGHNPETWADERFTAHLQGGIEWILHKQEGESKPNPEISEQLESKAKYDASQAADGKAEEKK